MRTFGAMIVSAALGAVLAVAVVLFAAQRGLLPINDRQMQTYLMTHPELAAAMLGRQQQLDEAEARTASLAAMKKVGQAAFFDPKIAFTIGPSDAKKTLVEFYDYNCPYCRASLPAMMKYVAEHRGDTRFAFIEFPIKGKESIVAARAALAAHLQPDHFLPFHFALMSEEGPVSDASLFDAAARAGLDVAKLKADMARPEIDKAITESLALAHKVGIDGTPTFIANGQLHPGAVDDATLAEIMKS
jgi:protein-disulfide isomerase